MTDEQISEIYALGRDAFFGGQKSFQVQAYPFHMTAENLAKHRNSPHLAFWKMLKEGSDHFEVTRAEPRVNVCEKRYVFDAQTPGDPSRPLSFSASGKCPVFEVDREIASLVQDKERKDDATFAELARRNVATAPIKTNADGGMNAVFVAAVKRNQLGVGPSDSLLSSAPPGTIPVTVRPPKIQELADAPASQGVASPATGEVSPPQMAIADGSATEPHNTSASKPFGFFSSLFGSKASATETKPAETKTAETKPQKKGAIDRMARLVGLRKDEAKDAGKTAETSKPKPIQAVSNGAIRPKAEPASVKTAEAQGSQPAPAAQSPWPAVQPGRQAAAAPAASANNSGAISGGAPVVPAGTFDNRWSGFR
jgi:hypothetical protein